MLDDGWLGPASTIMPASATGPSHRRCGAGLHPLVDKVTGLGMQFGLWFEPEMVNLDSAVARAHPDWIMATGHRLPVESRHQQVINLGIPECYAYIRDAIFDILAEYKIGYIKWDHNRDLIDAGTAPDGRPGVHTQTLAFYRLVDEIKTAHPGLEIESCSSGGARVDLGVLERTDRIWVSDCMDPVERRQMNRWTSQVSRRSCSAPTSPPRAPTPPAGLATCPSAPPPPSTDTSESNGTSQRQPPNNSPNSQSGSASTKPTEYC